jgi:hypothetical protein
LLPGHLFDVVEWRFYRRRITALGIGVVADLRSTPESCRRPNFPHNR